MKKIIALFLVIALTAVFAVSCGNKQKPPVDVTTESTTSDTTTSGNPSETTTTTSSQQTTETTEPRTVKEYIRIDATDCTVRILVGENGEYSGAAYVKYKLTDAELVIPSTYTYKNTSNEEKVYDVIQVGTGSSGAIWTTASMYTTKVTIPSTVKILSPKSFCQGPSLKTVNFGDGVETIGDMCFWNCISLENVVLPSSLKYIGELAFSGCTSLTSIVIPSSVTEIGKDAFTGCSALTSVTMPRAFEAQAATIFTECPNVQITYVD